MRRRDSFCLILAAAFALGASETSCYRDTQSHLTYLIEITPSDSGFERRITIFRTMNADTTQTRIPVVVEREVADRIGRAYGVRPKSAVADSLGPDVETTFVAHRRFAEIPNDLGNGGMLRHYASPLGRNWSYGERFRGTLVPPADLVASLEAADSTVDMLDGWLESELGRQPGWPELHSYLDVQLRRLLRDTAYRYWSSDSSADEIAMAHAYENPILCWMIAVAVVDFDDTVWEMVRPYWLREGERELASILGMRSGADADSALRRVCDPDECRQNLGIHLAAKAGETEEEAATRFWDTASVAVGYAPPQTSGTQGWDSVVVRLSLRESPGKMETNGSWDAEHRTVTWSGRVCKPGGSDPGDPLVCAAEWGSPDTIAQRRLFGSIPVDEGLPQYNKWFSTLDPAQQKEWNRMLMRVRPGKLDRLRAFKFSGAPSPNDEADIPGRKFLLEQLE